MSGKAENNKDSCLNVYVVHFNASDCFRQICFKEAQVLEYFKMQILSYLLDIFSVFLSSVEHTKVNAVFYTFMMINILETFDVRA